MNTAGKPVLFDVMGGVAPVWGPGHTSMFGDRAKPILHLVVGGIGQHPQKEVQERFARKEK